MLNAVRSRLILLIIAACWLAVSACTPAAPAPTTVPIATSTTAPTRTITPTLQPEPTGTPTPVLTRTPTFTPTPTSELAQASLFASGAMPGWRYFFTIQAPEAVTGGYYAIVSGNTAYTCEPIAGSPNRLFCSGPQTAVDRWVDYAVYEEETERLVQEGRFYIPIFDTTP